MSDAARIIEQRIRAARESVAAAEKELSAALSDLKVVQQPEKTMISKALMAALDNVTVARSTLEEIVPPKEG